MEGKHCFIIVSFFVTQKEALAQMKAQWAHRSKNHSLVLGRNITDVQKVPAEKMGGSIVLVDAMQLKKGILAEIEVPTAFGMCAHVSEPGVLVASGSSVVHVQNGKIVSSFSNSMFNDIHGLSRTHSGHLLVTSTGTDALFEVSLNDPKKICWEWLATEHGLDQAGDGSKKNISRDIDYRTVTTSTPEHTTHINSSLEYKKGSILATLFHQGTLVEINKLTGKSSTLLSGLQSPHSIRKWKNGFMLSDTRSNSILLLDNNFLVTKKIHSNSFEWVQDSLYLDETDEYLIADSNNGIIHKVQEDGTETSLWQYDNNSRKIAMMEYISVEQAHAIFGSNFLK